jgi:hypothetical protein
MASDSDVVEVDGRRYAKRGAQRGHRAPDEVYEALQRLADAGHIELVTVWCSEQGSQPASPGHFHGRGAVHLPELFRMVPSPGEGVELLVSEPYTFTLPLRTVAPDA